MTDFFESERSTKKPEPTSSPLETPSQRKFDPAIDPDYIPGTEPPESSPKSPFETQTGRIFAQLNAICFHSKMHGDCVGCLLGHAERLEIALNEQATPSPEPPRQTLQISKPEDFPIGIWQTLDENAQLWHVLVSRKYLCQNCGHVNPNEKLECRVCEKLNKLRKAAPSSPSSHSEPELVRLRRILRELVDECRSFGSPTLSLIDEVEAALASTPQNDNLSSGEAK